MERPETRGFQKPLGGKTREVGLAVISYVAGGATCSCHWFAKPARPKVVEDRIDRHIEKRHAGRGIRI